MLKMIGSTTTGPGSHAHLLVAEMCDLTVPESPATVMAEVEFRATHISSLMEEMFEESRKHDDWWEDDDGC
jgi:hypothetical protein